MPMNVRFHLVRDPVRPETVRRQPASRRILRELHQLRSMREVVNTIFERAQGRHDDQLDLVLIVLKIVQKLSHDQQVERVDCHPERPFRRLFR